jgi:hypothetical protein
MALQSSRAAASANPILTNYASGLAQDRRSAVAEFLAPTVVVPATVGHFKKYDDKNFYQSAPTGRAVGGSAFRVEFNATDPTYNCKPQALEIAIDDSERDAAGGDSPIILEQAKTEVLINTAVLSHEVAVLTAIKAGVSAESGKGVWSSPDIDPIDQIDEQINAIATATGMLPNRIAIGLGAWAILRRNKKVKDRVTFKSAGSIALSDFAACLLNPSIEIRLGVLVKDSTKMPATKSTSNVVGDECFIFYALPNPSTYDPSFAKTFRGGSGSVDSVRVYRDEKARSDILAVDWSEDIQVVASSCCKRISVT